MELREIIKNYIDNKNADYAILINGDWGCGKTFYVKHNFISKYNNNLYVSLYGISSIDKLSRSICNEILTSKTFNNKISSCIYKLWKNSFFFKVLLFPLYLLWFLFDKVQKVIIWIISFLTRNLIKLKFGIDLPHIKDFDYTSVLSMFKKLDNYVLIIDDLERSSIPFDIVFGFLNNLVEHKRIKCIIISNESEVDKINNENYELKVISVLNSNIDFREPDIFENKSNDVTTSSVNYTDIDERIKKIYNPIDKYKLVKEKLIGKTYDFVPDLDTVYDNVIWNYKDEPFKEISCNIKEPIINTFKNLNYYNIRTLQFFVDIYNDLSRMMNNIGIAKKDIEMISDSVLKTCIYYRKGYPLRYLINGQRIVELDINNNTRNIFKANKFLTLDFVVEYILSGYINYSDISQTVKSFKDTLIDDETDDDLLHKLEEYWFYTSDDLGSILSELIININDGVYNGRKLSKILQIISYLKNMEFDSKIIDKVINSIKDYISKNSKIHLVNEVFINDSNVLSIYNDLYNEISNIHEKCEKYDYSESIDKCANADDWGIELYNFISHYNRITQTDGLISYIDLNNLKKKFLDNNIKNIYYFKYALDEYYQQCNWNQICTSEKEKLNELNSVVINCLQQIKDPMHQYPLKIISELIANSIKKLK